jgi:predicted 2-oxoglutarate/Fe(II)-dependent dioxygenase YbiX
MSRAAMVRQIIDPWLCNALIDGFEDHPELHQKGDYRAAYHEGFDQFTSGAVPSDMEPTFRAITGIAARQFELPVNHANSYYAIGRYYVGGAQDWHRDYDPTHESGARRIVSWSLMLSRPGVDFTGGEFELESGPINLEQGDVIMFTAQTRHRVCRVNSGTRYVVICFAGR